MIRTHHQTMGMPMAAMPLLRMQSQTTTLNSLNQISELPSCEIAEVAVEDGRVISSALDVVLQIANQSASSYSSLVRRTFQKPFCAIVEVTGSGDQSVTQAPKSRLRQLMERIGALVAFIPPITFAIYLVFEECRKVKELQDQCIAIEQNDIWKEIWWAILRTCQSADRSMRYHQRFDKSDKQQKCDESLKIHWRTCKILLESARERCKLAENRYRRQHFRPDLIHRLKFLKEHYPFA